MQTSRDRSITLLVQNLQKSFDPLERIFKPFRGIDHAIAIPLQRLRLRFKFAQSPGQNRCCDGLRPDVEPHDTPALAIEPKLRHREEIPGRRRKPAKTKRGLFLQVFQIVFVPTPDDATIDLKPDRFRLDVVCRQHIRDRKIQIGNPETGCPVAGLLSGQCQKMAIKYRAEDLYVT